MHSLSNSILYRLESGAFQNVFNHVFLPRILPNEYDKFNSELEKSFLELIHEEIAGLELNDDDFKRTKILKQTLFTFDVWIKLQCNLILDGQVLYSLLQEFRENEIENFIIYFQSQNSCLIIKKHKTTSDTTFYGSFFQVQFKRELVLNTPGDCGSFFPFATYKIENTNILFSQSLAYIFAELANKTFEQCYSFTIKKGVEVREEREAEDPKLIHEFIMGLLAGACVEQNKSETKNLTTYKKIRDEVLYDKQKYPFRRSPLWMASKVCLSLLLNSCLDPELSRIIYKYLLLKVHIDIAEAALDFKELAMQDENYVFMTAKITRRIFKLNNENALKDFLILEKNIKNLFERALKLTTIVNEMSNLQAIEDFRKKQLVVYVEPKIEDTIHDFTFKKEINDLKDSLATDSRTDRSRNIENKRNIRNLINNIDFNFENLKNTSDSVQIQGLHDIEFLLDKKPEKYFLDKGLSFLSDLLNEYSIVANRQYKNNPVATSRKFMVFLQILIYFDKLAIKQYPSLAKHRFGVDVAVLEVFLAPKINDIERVKKIAQYLHKRNSLAEYPSLIDESKVSDTSFAVRFAKGNKMIMSLLTKYERLEKKNKECKEKEAKKKVQEYKTLIEKYNQADCRSLNVWSRRLEKFLSEHDRFCPKCNYWNEANNLTIEVYELLLPEKIIEKYAVLFELRIPIEISILRDKLFCFRNMIYGKNLTNFHKTNVKGQWRHNDSFSDDYNGLKNFLTLSSNTCLFSQTSYKGWDISFKKFDEYIVPNGYEVLYMDVENQLLAEPLIPSFIDISLFTYELPRGSIYKCLQWTLDGTSHNENQVLAAQASCPLGLDLREYIKYGCLRAGSYLQLKNIAEALGTKALSFERTEVIFLIKQALFTLEHIKFDFKEIIDWLPCHYDLCKEEFLENLLLPILKQYIESFKENWKMAIVIHLISEILKRIIALNKGPINLCLKNLLINCRKILYSFLITLEELKKNNTDLGLMSNINFKLLEISTYIILTYHVGRANIKTILRGEKDAYIWIICMKHIHENSDLKSNEGLTSFINSLVTQEVSLCLQENEELLHEIIVNTSFKLLIQIVKRFQPDYSHSDYWGPWKVSGDEICYKYSYLKNYKEFEINLKGVFLVNKQPASMLPKLISQNESFLRIFKNQIFIVQTDGVDKYSTIYKQNELAYNFYLKNSLIIEEVRFLNQKERRYIYIPPEIFNSNVPKLMVDNYSHWLDVETNVIELRPINFTEYTKDGALEIFYKIDLEKGTIKEENPRCEKFLIDNTKQIYKNIFQSGFDMMDNRVYVCIWYVRTPNKYQVGQYDIDFLVQLPRYSLTFVEGNGERNTHFFWKSVEYEGMILDYSQKLHTLYGLEQGIVLKQSNSKNKRFFLVPHGDIRKVNEMLSINTENIKHPSYFVYEIDKNLRQLKAETTTAWIYLAALHACTSKYYIDDFTGVTGVEMAVYLLQSARCWSCEPYPPEALQILLFIKDLSPIRAFYPLNMNIMQKIEWNRMLSNQSCSDVFYLITKKLIENSERLLFCYPEQRSSLAEYDNQENLLIRGYWKHARYLPPLAKMNEEFEKYYGGIPEAKTLMSETKNISDMNNVTAFSQAFMKREAVIITRNDFDFNFLKKNDVLKGLDLYWNSMSYTTLTDWVLLSKDFENNWLSLFSYATLCDKEKEYTLLILLSYSVFSNIISFEKAMNLMTISFHRDKFKSIQIPEHKLYESPKDYFMTEEIITSTLNSYKKSIKEFISDNNESDQRARALKEKINNSAQTKLLEAVEKYKKNNCTGDKPTLLDFYSNNNDYYSEYINETSIDIKSITSDLIGVYSRREMCSILYSPFLNTKDCLITMNNLFQKYYRNKDLDVFLKKVKETFELIPSSKQQKVDYYMKEPQYLFKVPLEIKFSLNKREKICHKIDLEECINYGRTFISLIKEEEAPKSVGEPESIFQQFPLNLSNQKSENSSIMSLIEEDLKSSWDHFSKFPETSEIKVYKYNNMIIRKEQNKMAEKAKNFENSLRMMWESSDIEKKLLINAGLWPRFVPMNYLNLFAEKIEKLDVSTKELILSIILCWIHIQKIDRLLALESLGLVKSAAFEREAENAGHTNWNITEHPEWLLMEYGMDLMIREVQIDITKAMISPEKKCNTVMQLNMGEGKTAVIVPILCASLADGNNLMQVTVLKSLFKMNKQTLTNRLATILNRKLYVVPFKRNFQFQEKDINNIRDVLEECKEGKGVVLTLPEYKLSFNLKALELIDQKRKKEARKFLEIRKFVESNVREIIDESDEILSVKYQLIYTLGKQDSVDEIRWITPQVILELGRAHFNVILAEFGENCFEYIPNELNKISFPQVRLLNKKPYIKLCKLICQDILAGKAAEKLYINNLNPNEIILIEEFIFSECLNEKANLKSVEKIFEKNIKAIQVIILLRGLFTHDIFFTVLQKRWRVNYGSKTIGIKGELLQAVPYRAKDVPAEKAQFGHTDITIFLTILNYYYFGLDDEKLDHIFNKLAKIQSRTDILPIYEGWVNYFNKYNIRVEASLQQYESINLEDTVQKRKLYDLFRNHPKVIDFWLNKILFPTEAKDFCYKIGTNAWDLCPSSKNKIMTGFSGTNDTKMLLPLNTVYQENPNLIGTNASLFHKLLFAKEKTEYRMLNNNTTAMKILELLVNEQKRLLIDVGALMIEFDNKTVAKSWLLLDKEAEAAVFFDPEDNLLVMDREFKCSAFHISPFKNRLAKCLIYIDDFHTRGTDLKIPEYRRGVVTLGKGLIKDRLMQACMRMRQLGKRHFVSFWASHEVHFNIMSYKNSFSAVTGEDVTAKDVIEWAIRNTRDYVADSIQFWATQGLSYFRRCQAFSKLKAPDKVDLNNLLTVSKEKDTKSIGNMYVNDRLEKTIPEIFKEKETSYLKHIGSSNPEIFISGSEQIFDKLNKIARDVKKYCHSLDEEQEIELEIELELEDERECQRPGNAIPNEPELTDDIRKLVTYSICNRSELYIPIFKAFSNTLLKKHFFPSESWEKECKFYITNEFLKVIKTKEKFDEFLRSPKWFSRILIPNPQKEIYLFLSSFEANELIKYSNKNREKIFLVSSRVMGKQKIPLIFPSPEITNYSELFSHVFFFSGSMFFNSIQEQDYFLKFLGLFPQPRSDEEGRLFDKELINRNSFLEKEKINEACKFLNRNLQINFDKHPGEFYLKLCELRHYNNVPSNSHHITIINFNKKNELF